MSSPEVKIPIICPFSSLINVLYQPIRCSFPSLEVTVNGSELKVTEDYTLSGDTLTLIIAPPTNSIIKVDYRVEPA